MTRQKWCIVQQSSFNIVKKFHNRDPFFIAHSLGIEVTFLDFNQHISAFSERKDHFDRGRIYINRNLGHYMQKLLCAHELGHMLLHDVCETTFFDADIEPQKEYEANYFTAMLLPQLINNEDIWDYSMEAFNAYIASRVYFASKT